MNPFDTTVPDAVTEPNVFDRMPSYLVAADNHNVANGDTSFGDYAKFAAGAAAGAAIGQAIIPIPIIGAGIGAVVGGLTAKTDGAFAATAILSGTNSFYNTGVAIGNWFSSGEETAQRDTESWISSIDSDLGQYYRENKETADLAGFVAGSIIPGTAGVKVFNYMGKALTASKTGAIGANMSEATGLLIPKQQSLIQAAIKEITSTSSSAATNANAIAAIGLGFGEQVLQAAAFEMAVTASMFKSPIMDQMDAKDIASNILHGALVGGVIGGVIDGVKVYGRIKSATKAADSELMPYTHIPALGEGATADENIVLAAHTKLNTPAKIDDILIEKYGTRPDRLLSEKHANLDADIRIQFQDIAKGDMAVSTPLADSILTLKTTDDIAGRVLGLREATRLTELSDIEVTLRAARRNLAKDAPLAPEQLEALAKYQTRTVKIWGEDAGTMYDTAPKSLGIQDMLKKNEVIQVTEQGVKIGKQNFIKFTSNEKKPWNIMAASATDTEARYLWAMHSKPLALDATVAASDLPLLEKIYREAAPTGALNYKIALEDGSTLTGFTKDQYLKYLVAKKQDVTTLLQANSVVANPNAVMTTAELARRTNQRVGYIERESVSPDVTRDLFATDSYAKEYAQRQLDAGIKIPSGTKPIDILLQPQHVKLSYDTTAVKDLDGNVLTGIAAIKQKQVIYRDAAEAAFNDFARDDTKYFARMPDEVTLAADRYGAGAGVVSSANGDYGTLASYMETIGKSTHNLIKKWTSETHEALEPSLYQIRNSVEATAELSTILNKVRGTPEKYVLSEGGDSLILRGLDNPKRFVLDANAAEEIPIANEYVQEFIAKHIQLNGERLKYSSQFRNINQGVVDAKNADTFYAPPVNPKDFKHFAFVTDESITGSGHVKMIYAATPKELDALMSKVPKEFDIITANGSARYHKAYGDYMRDEALHENYIDTALFRSGASAEFFPVSDPIKLTDELIGWHTQKATALVREGVATKYSKEFKELQRLGEGYTDIATSKYGTMGLMKNAQDVVHNPYIDYTKTALDITKVSDIPIWSAINNQLDSKFSAIWDTVNAVLKVGKKPEDLSVVNDVFDRAGIKTAVYDASLSAWVNHTAPKGALTSFVQRSNAILSTLTIRMDPLNALNNTVGSAVLGAPEVASVINAIKAGSAEGAGELSKLANIKLVGTDSEILSPHKLIANSFKNFFDATLKDMYKEAGYTQRHVADFHSILDDLTLKGTESVRDLESKMHSAYEKFMKFGDMAEKYTGNKLAEEFNRFVAADVMRQITDVGVKHGVLAPDLAHSYINTFVNRTQGNYLASQRPLMFSGPVGQAMGLFQTYQFNLAQQLLRHVAEGTSKDAAMLLGLQGTIYGMNGLPAFNAINTHIIGTASGNTNHKDMYTATYGAAGKEAGDWMMYGVASNVLGLLHPDLKMNLYSRGDINPRQATVVPTNIADLPFVNASAKFFSNLSETVSKLGMGGDPATTILQGVEHNGLNRPLGGLAQALEAFTNPAFQSYSTSNRGNLSASNDFFSLVNLGRIAGGKPLDEALVQDAAFRYKVYDAKDSGMRNILGESIKTTIMGGNSPSSEQIENFTKEYMKAGGKQERFNQFFMGAYKEANASQANQIADKLKSANSQAMQSIMGGYRMKDFTNAPP